MALNTEKNLKLYYSIKEVAAMLNVPESMLRFGKRRYRCCGRKQPVTMCASIRRPTLRM